MIVSTVLVYAQWQRARAGKGETACLVSGERSDPLTQRTHELGYLSRGEWGAQRPARWSNTRDWRVILVG